MLTANTSAPTACWECGASLSSTLLCISCGKLQPASNADYFQVFGLPRLLAVDTARLGQEFHRLSRKLHPDRFVRASDDEKQWSLANTALLNDAYRTLRDPIKRVEYLLTLEGLKVGEEHSGKGKSGDRQPPADLLEEVFELNMQLEEMRANLKMGESDPVLNSDLETAKLKFEHLLSVTDQELATKGDEWDAGNAEIKAGAANALAAILDRRRYLKNLVRDVNDVLANASTNLENHA
jgi:molecular chaperone HscB